MYRRNSGAVPVNEMRLCSSILIALCAALAGTATARAQTGPVIVVPGRPDHAVTINGVVVNGAVVYGDWGLARPGHGQIIIEGPVGYSGAYGSPGYFPSAGHVPRYGRHEILPPPRPRRSTEFYREWYTESDRSRPVTQYPPFDPPPVVLAPLRGPR
jgi:hypothetical protein